MDESDMEISAQCLMCRHFLVGRTCTAFTKKIPDDIYLGFFDHRKPYKDDHGIRFELKECYEEPCSNAFKMWTKDDDARLLKEKQDGKTIKALAEVFDRTPEAIKSRLRSLRLKEVQEQQEIHLDEDMLVYDETIHKKYRAFQLINLVDSEMMDTHIDAGLDSVQKIAETLLEGLSPRETEIIEKRFLTVQGNLTLEQLARVYDISRQRVKQIESKAIVRMKNKYLLGKVRDRLGE